jgi:hypothetical protein
MTKEERRKMCKDQFLAARHIFSYLQILRENQKQNRQAISEAVRNQEYETVRDQGRELHALDEAYTAAERATKTAKELLTDAWSEDPAHCPNFDWLPDLSSGKQ